MVTARWGTAKDIEPYVDPVFENNVLLTATERSYDVGQNQSSEVCKKQKHSCYRRFRFRQDSLFCETQPDADAQLLCCDGPEGKCETFQSEKDWHISTESLFIVMKLVRVGELNA